MKNPEHPLRQGALDWLCSVYAVINLAVYRKIISHHRISEAFEKIIHEIVRHPEGNLAKAVLRGLDPEDVPWMAEFLGIKLEAIPADFDLSLMSKGGVIFYEDPRKSRHFTHYTVVIAEEKNTFKLYDSYGFSEIKRHANGWKIDSKFIRITHAWR